MNMRNMIETESYKQHGKRSKEKILEIIKNEGINIKSSFDYSVQHSSSYHQWIRVVRNHEEETYHTVTIPTFTDDSDVEQAIILAYELGHYFVWKSSSKIKRSVLYTGLNTSDYINDKLTWKKAKEILVKEGIIDEKGDEDQKKAFEDFLQIKYSRSVKNPLFSIIRAISRICKRLVYYLIYSYLLVGFFLVFEANNIPIPLINKIGFDLDHFYTNVKSIFILFVISELCFRICSFLMMKNKN